MPPPYVYPLPNGKKAVSQTPLSDADLREIISKIERPPPPPVESPYSGQSWEPSLGQRALDYLPDAVRIGSGFGGPITSGAGELAASGLEYLMGEEKTLGGVARDTAIATAAPKVLQYAARGARALPALGRRVLPWMHDAAETGRKAAFEAEQLAERAAVREAKRGFREEEIARRAEHQSATATYAREVAERAAQERELLAAEDLARRERIKSDLQGIATPTGASKGLYEAADAAAVGQRLTSVPGTDKVAGELIQNLSEGNPLQPFLSRLTEASGYDIPAFIQTMKEVGRIRTPEARRLYEAMAADLGQHPQGAMFREAAESFKQDVGREMVGDLVAKAGPVAAPINVKTLASGFEKGREGLERLPDDQLARVEALIREAQTPLTTPQIAGPMPAEPGMFLPRVYRGPEVTPRSFEPQALEGPLANWGSLSTLAGATGLGAYYGNPYAGALVGAAQMAPPMIRAMQEVGENPGWLDALISGATQAGRVGVDALLEEGW